MNHPSHDSPFMRAVRREPAEHTPVWLMRQAGRYMAEYRAVRERVPFLELCKTPALCAEVMLTAVERIGVDAAILFSDLLLILEPMGLGLEFTPGDGPVLHNPIREPAEVDRLRELDDCGPLQYVFDAVRHTRAGLPDRLPLIGFAGAPFTLAAYAIEGGGSRNYLHVKRLMLTDPGAWDALMARLARSIARYLIGQIEAGAQVVQLFDSWVGCLGVDDYRRFVLPHTRAVVEAVEPHAPVIHFGTGNPVLLRSQCEAGGQVLGADWRIPLDEAWAAVGYDRAIQGNLDPAVLLAPLAEIERRVQRILDLAGGRPGHIFNLGHGVLPQTPVENAAALVQMVHERSRSTA